MTKDAGPWAGLLMLAFVWDDFVFCDSAHCCIPPNKLLLTHQRGKTTMVHVQFWFDKSKPNFSIKIIQSTNNPILNPVVDAAVSIIH
jgi:hypothetical protein